MLIHVQLFVTAWTPHSHVSLSFTISWSLFKLMSFESVMPSNDLVLRHPLFLPPIFPNIMVFPMNQFFASDGQSIGVSASTSVFPMNIQDWFPLGLTLVDLLAVQETLKSLLQHHSSKASILWCSAFFIVQLSHPCVTTGKTIALTRCISVGKVMSLLSNMLSRLVIAFLPRSKRPLILLLQSPSAVTLFPLFPHLFAMKG